MQPRRRNTILEGLERMRRDYPTINMMQALAFLYAAENEGINLAELAAICRTTRATASRSARALAGVHTRGGAPEQTGLIELRPNPDWTHGRLVYLGDAGRRLVAELEGLIAEARPIAYVGAGPDSADLSRAAAE